MMSYVQTRDICSGCFDLNPDFFPAKHHSSVIDEWCTLDEWWIGVKFSDIRDAATAKACEKCGILYAAISDIRKQLDEGLLADKAEPEWDLRDSTNVDIYGRPGHSLRVNFSNDRKALGNSLNDVKLEFYTCSATGA